MVEMTKTRVARVGYVAEAVWSAVKLLTLLGMLAWVSAAWGRVLAYEGRPVLALVVMTCFALIAYVPILRWFRRWLR